VIYTGPSICDTRTHVWPVAAIKLKEALVTHFFSLSPSFIQHYGLLDNLGKKDKITSEQAIFDCLVCKCEIKGIKTLKAHCQVRRKLSQSDALNEPPAEFTPVPGE
jgi:hypothetical protein